MSLDSGFVLTELCAHTLLYVPCDSKCILGMAHDEIQGLWAASEGKFTSKWD